LNIADWRLWLPRLRPSGCPWELPSATSEKQMKTQLVFRAIIAASLVLALTLLFDYCRYEIERHPHFDVARLIYLSVQGLIVSINFAAMLKLVEAFAHRS
jgi:hypothetical protein